MKLSSNRMLVLRDIFVNGAVADWELEVRLGLSHQTASSTRRSLVLLGLVEATEKFASPSPLTGVKRRCRLWKLSRLGTFAVGWNVGTESVKCQS
jgi:hypothetical protein